MAEDYPYAGPANVLKVLPERKPEGHKGSYGRLLVVGGGSQYAGAPALVALAALRSGVDLATVAAPAETAQVINSFSPDIIAFKLDGKDFSTAAFPGLSDHLKRATAVVVGPGLGTSSEAKDGALELARVLAQNHPKLPVMFDADGLKLVASDRRLLRNPNWLVTPHAGEFRLLSDGDLPTEAEARVEEVKNTAKSIGCTILLKSNVDIIASPKGDCALNRTGNPGMTVGGTGDVLAGIAGAFLAQGTKPFEAAVAGAFLCGRAGDLCREEKGYEFLASDVIEKLPAALSEVRSGSNG